MSDQINRNLIIAHVRGSLGEIYAMKAWHTTMDEVTNPIRDKIDPAWGPLVGLMRNLLDKDESC